MSTERIHDSSDDGQGLRPFESHAFLTYRFAARLRERLMQQASALDLLIGLGVSDGQDGIDVATLVWRRTETLRQLSWVERQMGRL